MKLRLLTLNKSFFFCIFHILYCTQYAKAASVPSPTPTAAPQAQCVPPQGYTAVRNAVDFNAIREIPSARYFLCNDIVLGPDFSPIPMFSGTLKGNSKKILNLRLIQTLPRNNTESFKVGLFETLSNAGLSDLIIENAQINSRAAHEVGFLAGHAESSRIENILVRNSVLLAEIPIVSLNPVVERARYHGGVVGVANGSELINTEVSYDVIIDGPEGIGGIVGKNGVNSIVRSSRSHAQMTALMSELGGIVANNLGRIERSYSTGTLKGSELIGGIVGVNFGDSIDRCYSFATVQGENFVGGIAGVHLLNSISNSYSAGNVVFSQGGGSALGGFVGLMDSSEGVRIENSYSISVVKLRSVPLEPESVGSFIGDVWAYDPSRQHSLVLNSYYDRDRNPGLGSILGEPRSSIEMKSLPSLAVTYKNWNFETVWSTRSGQYPKLRNP